MATVSIQDLPALPQQSKPNSEFQNELEEIERKYGSTVCSARIRLVEMFQDFDPMRSGLMSESRFVRCVLATLERGHGNHLSQAEIQILLKEYLVSGTKMIKVSEVNVVFEAPQDDKVIKNDESAIVSLPFRKPVSPQSENILKGVLDRLKAYGNSHGSDIKSWFHDFDTHRKGWINYNQFRRGMPLDLLSPEESDLILVRYGDAQTNTVNYFKLFTDVTRKPPPVLIAETQVKSKSRPDDFERAPIGTEEVLQPHHYGAKDLLLASTIEEKIKQYIYKNRIKMNEFFRDYDRHNCGFITQNQFWAGFKLARLPLENPEIVVIISKYRHSDGRLNYRLFCKNIETIFTKDNLESFPMENVQPPSREWLIQQSNKLTPEEEIYCGRVIVKLQKLMKERRVLLDPFFKDYDKTLGNMGRVTRSHFSRLLYTTGLMVSQDDLHILFKKFEDHSDGRIKYMDFIQKIDPETYVLYSKTKQGNSSGKVATHIDMINPYKRPAFGINELISNLQIHAVTRRIKVAEFFKDFDKLRCYSIGRVAFERGLYLIGYHLTEDEVELICDHYKDENRKGMCRWYDFSVAIDRVFGEPNLESKPSFIHEKEPVITPFEGGVVKLSPRDEAILQRTIERIRGHLKFRKPSVKLFFRDCDKINCSYGHVTKSQLRQCLVFMECDVSEEEFDVICRKWAKITPDLVKQKDFNYINDRGTGICYIHFLEQVERESEEKPMFTNPVLKKVVKSTEIDFEDPHSEFEKLMMKIKTKAKTERIRVIDSMADFDLLRHGKISTNKFFRAAKVLFGDLTENELKLLASKFAGPDDTVRYLDFSDSVESVFTKKGLESSPTAMPDVFDVYSNGWETDSFINILDPADKPVLEKVMKRIQEKVKERRIEALSYMEDYDFVNEGTITTNQFRSVLNQMNLGVTDKEFNVITKFFAANHSMTRVNYRKLALYELE